jgi:protocatechuate 3,4-dioxygenase alpha subunit
MAGVTPSQTIGPYFHMGMLAGRDTNLVSPDDPDAVRIRGRVTDGTGEAAADACIEVWQANRAGRYAHPEDDRDDLPLEEGFSGFARCPTDDDGRFELVTVKPGPVPFPDGRMQARHIDVSVFARGLLNRVVTRIYFPDEEARNAADPVLSSIDDAERRATLVARAEGDDLVFDIVLQGDGETAFFAV